MGNQLGNSPWEIGLILKIQTHILDSGCVKNNLKHIGKKQQYDVVHSYYTFRREVTWHRDLRQNTKCKKRPLGHKAHF